MYGIPITTLIFRSYYATIPEDLIEAARMDRAGMLRTYWSVVLPISAPAFVVTAIWQFTSIWNDFLFAVFLITNPSSWPVTVALNNTTGSLVALQRADGRGADRVAADAHRLHPARPLLHARPDGRGAERLGSGDMADIKLDKLGKQFSNGFWAVKELSLEIAEAELLVLVGPSGCGKTTALRMIAGLEDISEGDLYISGTRVNDVLERDRDIAMVFQNYALYPHMTVAQNIAFSLRLQRPKEIKQRVQETAKLLGLEELLDRKPKQLSGGQETARGDGPGNNSPAAGVLSWTSRCRTSTRSSRCTCAARSRPTKRLGVTTVYVTHDQVEAMTMGDRVVLRGVLQQVDTPTNVYDRPANLFVAGFSATADEPRPRHDRAGWAAAASSSAWGARRSRFPASFPRPRARGLAGRELIVGIAPRTSEDRRRMAGLKTVPPWRPRSTASRRSARAPLLLHRRRAAGSEQRPSPRPPESGLEEVALITREGTPFCATFEPRSAIYVGDTVEVTVDVRHLHFFDPETEQAIGT